jgi:hypothetical protein
MGERKKVNIESINITLVLSCFVLSCEYVLSRLSLVWFHRMSGQVSSAQWTDVAKPCGSMLFCPVDGSLLLTEFTSDRLRFFCRTCPYIRYVHQNFEVCFCGIWCKTVSAFVIKTTPIQGGQ